jgi:Fe-S oxidoreductase
MRFNVCQVSDEVRDGFKVLDRRTGREVSTHNPESLTRSGWLYRWAAELISVRLNADFDQWAHWYGVEE